MLIYVSVGVSEDTHTDAHDPKHSLIGLADGAPKPAPGKTARMIASLAICVFSGLILWVFRRRAGRVRAC
jgi:hypothetical protein